MAHRNFIGAAARIVRQSPKTVAGIVIGLAVSVVTGFWLSLPAPLFDASYSTVLLDRQDRLLGAAIAEDQQWRFPPVDRLPPKIVTSIVNYEDRRFFSHPGVDPLALGRALRSNIRAGRIVSGASTITMQVMRLSRPGRPRSLKEKIIEMILALRLEMTMGKDGILTQYAAHAPFGGNVVGIEAASWRYFGRGPQHLSWAEAAMLAVLPNNPALVHPGRNRRALFEKRNRLLDLLQTRGYIDAVTRNLAKAEALPPKPLSIPRYAPHLMSRLKPALRRGAHTTSGDGRGVSRPHRIRTTLIKETQLRAIEVIRRHHQRLAANGIFNAAALIMEVASGRVVAYVGNVHDFNDRKHGSQVDVIIAPRSTGSILKPMLYAAMLESGELLPHTLVADIPTRLGGFAPQNYTRTYLGAVPAAKALARSLNVPAVRMLRDYGIDRFYNVLTCLGMTTLIRPAEDYGLSLILGGAEGRLWDITAIYAGMARRVLDGHEPLSDRRPAFRQPRLLEYDRPQGLEDDTLPSRRISGDMPGPAACWLTLEAMLEVVRPGLDGAWKQFTSSRKVAWKTGTSYGHRDGWAVGVTPAYAVGVWTGNADGEGRPGLTGVSTAAPVLFELLDLLDHTQPDANWFSRPPGGLAKIGVCAKSGHRAGPYCEEIRDTWITDAGKRTPPCPYCRVINCDTTLTRQVHGGCERVADIRRQHRFVLPPAMEWYYRQNHSGYRPLPPYRDDCLASINGGTLKIISLIYPARNGNIYVPLELDGKRGRTVFEAAHRRSDTAIYWHLDRQYIGFTRHLHQLTLAPAPGEHVLTLVDEEGNRLQRKFTVLAKKNSR